jgi:hypothetical protein
MPGFLDSKWVELVIAPVLTGLLASLFFLIIASRFRPRLKISTHIAKMPPSAFGNCNSGACTGYAVKVLNTSHASSIEIKARMSLVSQSHVKGGFIGASEDFTLRKSELFELPGKGKDPEDSAFRFVTHDNIELNWDDDHYFVLSLFAKHALTGFGKVFTQRYDFRGDSVKEGVFDRGESMEIHATQPHRRAAES